MIVTIAQPPYLPWLGFFDRVLKSDVLVLLDTVAMDRNSRTKFLNRNKLRTKDGWTWITVPLVHAAQDQPISELTINNGERWAERHWRTIELNYARAPHFATQRDAIEAIYKHGWSRPVELNVAILDLLFSGFGMKPRVELASAIGGKGAGGTLLVNICRELGATAYVSGPFGRDYIDRQEFTSAGIDLLFHDYVHPTYTQVFPGFEPFMSALDLLLNEGKNGREVLESPMNTLVKE
jgi:hypothetical protein